MTAEHFSHVIASSLPTKKFVDPDACSVPFPEVAQQNVTSLLKNESEIKQIVSI
jgi:hypothetical protein